jgi:MGT family glycosyltransferase
MPEHGPGPFAQVSTTLETLLEFSSAILDEHLEEVRRLRPARIMFDSFAPWGRMIAHLLGLPAIASVPSLLVNAAIDARYGAGQPGDPRLTQEWYGEIRARCEALFGSLAPQELLQSYGDLNLVYTSRFFQPRADCFDQRRFRFIGPCFQFRPDAPEFPFERLDGRPLILISLGTVYGERPEFLERCLEDLADAPWQVVLSTGHPAAARRAPANFLVRPFVPQVELLRHAAAFVTHGGMNSVQEALYYGVPMVIAPQAADQFWISARTRELGAATVLDSARLERGAIRARIGEVLAAPGYAHAAARIAQSLRAAGGAMRAACEIQDFAFN